MDSKVKPPKEKKRNSERRKEKSRDAARCRRSKESEIFTDLASLLPLSSSTVASLDKASIMRLAISFLKTKNILDVVPTPAPLCSVRSKDANPNPCNVDSVFLKALDGFLLVISTDGDLVFLSENVNEHLGLSQIDLMGQSIYEVTHPCDHTEIKSVLSTKDVLSQKSIFIRLKCTLTSKGRNVNVKAASYKVIHCTGHLVQSNKTSNSLNEEDSDKNNNNKPSKVVESGEDEEENVESENDLSLDGDKCTENSFCFVAIAEPIPHPANYERPLSRHTFLTKHSLDMKFTYADETMETFLKFNPETFLSKCVFEYHHAQDSFHVQHAFKNLFLKGQCETDHYRFLACGGGYIWVLTQATLIYSKSQKPQSVVCVNFVLSDIEYPEEIFSLCQLPKNISAISKSTPAAITAPIVEESVSNAPVKCAPKPVIVSKQENTTSAVTFTSKPKIPVVTTSAIFAPKQVVVKQPSISTLSVFGPKPIEHKPLATEAPLAAADELDNSLDILPELGLDVSTVKPLVAAPLEEILPLPQGVVVPKVQHPLSFAAPVPLQNSNNATQNPVVAAAGALPKPIHNEVTTKFLATISPDNPLLRVFAAENNAIAQAPRPQAATAKIFAPRTKDMNKGYLTFADDDTGRTMLKEEVDDLTHLAPTPGDGHVPLDSQDSIFGSDFVFDDFILQDSYHGTLINDNYDNPSKQLSPVNSYYTYRDDRSLSPTLTHSPGGCSLPSLSSIEDSPPMIEDTSLSPYWAYNFESPDELSVRAPYIPMSESDDLPLNKDLMWGSHSVPKPICQDHLHINTKSWSKTNSPNNSYQQQQSPVSSPKSKLSSAHTTNNTTTNSSLAKLLKSDNNNSRNNFDDGGGGGDASSQGNRYKCTTKKGSNGSTVLENKKSGKRSAAAPPEWDHRGYWKRNKAPSSQQQTPNSKHSNSVLMNLLVSGCDSSLSDKSKIILYSCEASKRARLKSFSSMIDESKIQSIGNLTTQDFETNAPSSSILLGEELLNALEESIRT